MLSVYKMKGAPCAQHAHFRSEVCARCAQVFFNYFSLLYIWAVHGQAVRRMAARTG